MISGWTGDELDCIDAQDELQIAARRGDGSLRDPVIIWMVRDGGELNVRSVNGPEASWYRGTRARHEGLVSAADRSKYRRYGENALRRITSPEARSTTLRLTPRS